MGAQEKARWVKIEEKNIRENHEGYSSHNVLCSLYGDIELLYGIRGRYGCLCWGLHILRGNFVLNYVNLESDTGQDIIKRFRSRSDDAFLLDMLGPFLI